MTQSVQLRRHRFEDVDALHDAVIDSFSELSQWLSWCHPGYSRDETIERIRCRHESWEKNEEWSYLIVDEDDQILGSCGLHHLDLKNAVGEIGYWVRTSATGRGVATSATRQLCHKAFHEFGLERVEIVVSVENQISLRVAEKTGAIREGILRKRIVLNGRRHDCVLFSLLKEEFAGVTG